MVVRVASKVTVVRGVGPYRAVRVALELSRLAEGC